MTLPQHLEKYLGLIERGWKLGSFQIVKYQDEAPRNSTAFSTLGLSKHCLDLPGNKTIKIELLSLIKHQNLLDTIPAVLNQLGETILASHKAPLRGEVFGPWGSILPNSTAEAFYITEPVYYEDEFVNYFSEKGDQILIIWIVPITHKETHFIQSEGWQKFEDILEKEDPDLTDFYRPSCI